MNFKKLLMIALFSFGLVNSAFVSAESNKSVTHQPATAKRTFNQLTKKEQNTIIQFEKRFKPELRAKVRELLFDDEKMTTKNFVLILNKQLGRNYVKIKDGKIEFNYIPPNKFTELWEIFSQFDDIYFEGITAINSSNNVIYLNLAPQIFFEGNVRREEYTDKQLQEFALNQAMKLNDQRNYIEAADSFEILAEDARNAMAQLMLGGYYLKGAGVKQDIGKAKKYWKLACGNGSKIACEIYNQEFAK